MNLTQTIDAARNVMRFKHMSYRTEQAYVHWMTRYAYWCREHTGGSHEDKVRAFLTYLAREREVSASTQNQALNAVVFLYKHVLQQDVGDFSGFHPARQPRRLPVVLSRAEVDALLGHLRGMHWLIVALLYGAGLRLTECLMLRIKDVDFARNTITVREGKGDKDRSVMLPAVVADPLRHHIEDVRRIHARDLACGLGDAYMPHALARKFTGAVKSFGRSSRPAAPVSAWTRRPTAISWLRNPPASAPPGIYPPTSWRRSSATCARLDSRRRRPRPRPAASRARSMPPPRRGKRAQSGSGSTSPGST